MDQQLSQRHPIENSLIVVGGVKTSLCHTFVILCEQKRFCDVELALLFFEWKCATDCLDPS